MKFSNYIPEFVCLLLFTLFSCFWVISLKEDKTNSVQLSPLLALEKLIPQHEVQLLNTNFSDQLNYDQLAQLQSELEALIFEVNLSDTSEQLLKDYKETSLSYTQLTSMLKTSQRLVSEISQHDNTYMMRVIDNIRLKMFSFISSPIQTDKNALIELLNSIDINDKQQANWQHLQLIKLHSLFVLNNYELTAEYRQKLIEMPVVDAITQERALLEHQIKRTTIKQFVGIFGSILALVLLSFVVIKRHQYVLKKNSELHTEFVSNLMDMLGPNAENLLSKPVRGNKNGDPSMRMRSRK